jgi:glutaredoxin
MNKKIIVPSIFFVLVLVFSFFVLFRGKNMDSELAESGGQSESQIILFYGTGCPHCAIVDEYLEENNVKEKVAFAHKEVYFNRTNAKKLEEKASACGMPTNSIGVPFLWDGEKCFVGDKDIIDFFKQKINIQ